MADNEKDNMTAEQILERINDDKSSYRPGLEVDLVDQFYNFLANSYTFKNRKFCLKREVGVGRNIADLVAILFPNRTSHSGTAQLTAQESVLASLIKENGAVSPIELEKKFSNSASTNFSKMLEKLLRYDVVKLVNQKLTYQTDWPPLEIIAYEAKLKNWRTALKQAITYQRFADRSYVVMPEGLSAPTLNNIDLFKQYNVGLILVSDTGITTICRPKSLTPIDWRREFVASRIDT
jgi:hypothetical protein